MNANKACLLPPIPDGRNLRMDVAVCDLLRVIYLASRYEQLRGDAALAREMEG